MFTQNTFRQFGSYTQRFPTSIWWAVMLPGLFLILMALSIILWPELLAYLVATLLLFAGSSLAAWGWSLRRLERQRAKTHTVYYEVI